MASDPAAGMAKMAANLKTLTGKSLEQWAALSRKGGPATHGKLVAWLKSEHELTHGYANLVAHTTFKSDAASRTALGDDLVGEMFGGDRAVLRPIFDKLLKAILAFGGDIEQAPKKGYLSLRRSSQFAALHPSTTTRFDVGIKLKGTSPAGRLEAAGSWNAMVTHRVRLASPTDVDKELIGWLRQAYEQA